MIKLQESDFSVEFDDSALESFKQYQQKNGEFESGGILVGEVYLRQNKVIVRQVIVSKKAKRSLFGVNIDKVEMQYELEKTRINTNYQYYYIGDWHTHSEQHPTPSMVDNISYKKTVRKAVLQTNFVVFLIVGNGDDILDSLWLTTYFK